MSTTQPAAQPVKKGGGCKTGCLIVLVIFLLSAGAVLYIINRTMSSLVETITTTTPVAVTVVQVDPGVAATAGKKYQQVVDALSAVTAAAVSFSANEINMLIAGHPDFKIWREKLYVEMSGDSADLKFNFPLGMLTEVMPSLTWLGFDVAGRHINGRTVGAFSMKGDEVLVKLSQLEFNGEKAGAEVMREINSGLAKKRVIDSDRPEAEKLFQKIELISVENGQLVVRTRAGGS